MIKSFKIPRFRIEFYLIHLCKYLKLDNQMSLDINMFLVVFYYFLTHF